MLLERLLGEVRVFKVFEMFQDVLARVERLGAAGLP
jgi:hypothetical protein